MKHKAALSLIIVLTIFSGCTLNKGGENTPATPVPTIIQEVSEPIVFDEMELDMDGDGETEILQLTSGISKLTDGYCLEPLLLLIKNGKVIVTQTVFGNSGEVAPYFIQSQDINGDLRCDVLIGYEAKSFGFQIENRIYGISGNTFELLSPDNAYLATLYAISGNEQATIKGTQLNKKCELLTDIDQYFRTSDNNKTITLWMRMNGPNIIGDHNSDRIADLEYGLVTYDSYGNINSGTVWIQYDNNLSQWDIIDWYFNDMKNVAVTSFSTYTNSLLEPGCSTNNHLFKDDLTYINSTSSVDFYRNKNSIAPIQPIYTVDSTPLTTYDTQYDHAGNYILSVRYDARDWQNITPYYRGDTIEEVKRRLGEPIYENNSTLAYMWEMYASYTIPAMITSEKKLFICNYYFSQDRLSSIEISVNTDYQINSTKLNIDNRFKPIEYWFSLCGFRDVKIPWETSCICFQKPKSIGAGGFGFPTALPYGSAKQGDPLAFPAGRNIRCEYWVSETGMPEMNAEYHSFVINNSWPQFGEIAASSMNFFERPYLMKDYDNDGKNDVLVEVFSNEYFFLLYTNFTYRIDSLTEAQRLCDLWGNTLLYDDIQAMFNE